MGWWHFIQFCRKLIKQIGEDDLSGHAAEMAYKFFLALFPFLIFLVSLGSFVADAANVANPAEEVISQIGSNLPADAASVFETQIAGVTESQNPGLLTVGFIGALWAASSAMGTIIKVLNRTLEVQERRSLPKKYAVTVGLTLLGGIFIMASVVVLVAGQAFGADLVERAGLEGFAATAVLVARYVVIVVLLLLALAFIFWAAPAIRLPFKWITPGAVFFVVTWLPFTYLFGLYVANFGSYNATYGALGGIVVLLVWIYLSSFIFLISAEINAILANRETAEKVAETEEQPKPGLIARLKEVYRSSVAIARRRSRGDQYE